MIRIASATLVLLGLCVVGAPPAVAHSDLRSAVPAAGSTLSAPPRSVTLKFSEPVRDGFSRVAVTGAQGEVVSAGDATVSGPQVEQAVRLRAAGPYTVAYRVVSADGHVVQGRLDFRYEPPAGASPSPAAAPSPTGTPAPTPAAAPAAPAYGGEAPGWVFLVIVGPALTALVAIGVLLIRNPPAAPAGAGPTPDAGADPSLAAAESADDSGAVATGSGPAGPAARGPDAD